MDKAYKETEVILNNLEVKISKEYQQAYKEMSAKADAYFDKFAAQDDKMREKVKNKEMTRAEYQQWRANKMLMGTRWTNMKETLARDLTNADKIAMSYVRNTMADVYALNMNYATYDIEHDSRIDTSFTLYDKSTVQRLIKDNPDLLPQPSVDIPKDMKWNSQHIQSALTQSILQGENVDKLASRLQKVTNMDRSAAIRNARTATTGAQNAGRLDSYRRASDMGIYIKKVWMATLDHVTRDSHVDLDGEEQELESQFSNGLMYPGDSTGVPAEVYNCRCTMVKNYDKYKTDWKNLENRNNDKLGSMSYDEWKEEHTRNFKRQEIEPKVVKTEPSEEKPFVHTNAYNNIMERIKNNGISELNVVNLNQDIKEDEIIAKIGGGDMTKGSCSSLSYAYIGNKCGYDVTDFRGGKSCDFFSRASNEMLIRNIDGVESQVFVVQKEASDIAKKLKELDLPKGVEYRLTCGRHAAIIKNTDEGYKYLELQTPDRNGWKLFTERERLRATGIVDGRYQFETYTEKCSMADTLKERFGCRVSKSNNPIWDEASGGALRDENGVLILGSEMELTRVDSYKESKEFKDILGYINTKADKQMKGDKGGAR